MCDAESRACKRDLWPEDECHSQELQASKQRKWLVCIGVAVAVCRYSCLAVLCIQIGLGLVDSHCEISTHVNSTLCASEVPGFNTRCRLLWCLWSQPSILMHHPGTKTTLLSIWQQERCLFRTYPFPRHACDNTWQHWRMQFHQLLSGESDILFKLSHQHAGGNPILLAEPVGLSRHQSRRVCGRGHAESLAAITAMVCPHQQDSTRP